MRKQTKKLMIPKSIKEKVWERDNHCCILCGNPNATPSCHFVSRAQGGLGIEQNIVTLCTRCHAMYDQSENRESIRKEIFEYLRSFYPNLKTEDLIYKKYVPSF